MPPLQADPVRAARSPATLAALALCAALLIAGFTALGLWQLQRLAWKQDLIARVEQRRAAAVVEAPGPAQWPTLTRAADEYRRVRVSGRYAHRLETQVRATTELGTGYWVLTPMRTDPGYWLLVNRGFITAEQRPRAADAVVAAAADRAFDRPEGLQTVVGLMRSTEPGGSLLQANRPDAGRWYSRDVAAIAGARGLDKVAPYFVDAAADGAAVDPPRWPRPGLTVLAFSNNHLVYALTWFALAAMSAVAGAALLLSERRLRRGDAGRRRCARASPS